jgi:4-hydroxymandelate oxidase
VNHGGNGRAPKVGRASALLPSRDPILKKGGLKLALHLRDFEAEARRRLPPAVFDYIAGGSDDEVTLRENEAAFARLGLVPRVLRSGGPPQLETRLLGSRASMPILIAPTAFHRLVHPEGECATARAAAAAGTIFIASMASTIAIEDVVAAARGAVADGAGADIWFQLNIQPDLAFTEVLVRRAESAGMRGARRYGRFSGVWKPRARSTQRFCRAARWHVL